MGEPLLDKGAVVVARADFESASAPGAFVNT
jgi:hypothetical protein